VLYVKCLHKPKKVHTSWKILAQTKKDSQNAECPRIISQHLLTVWQSLQSSTVTGFSYVLAGSSPPKVLLLPRSVA
jgi:hypothetical protein